MITTEENIVYQLLNIIRAEELNNDEVVDERSIRALLRIHRVELLNRYSKKGTTIQDVCFQKLANVSLNSISLTEYTATLTNILQLGQNFGVKISTPEFENIPLVSEESYFLGIKNPINKYQPKAKIENQKLTVYVGVASPNAMDSGIRIQNTIDSLTNNKVVIIKAVLDDPDAGEGYDWTTSQYPFPSEIIGEMKKNILRREFNIILSTKSDQIPNMKNDTLKYYEQGKVQQ